MKKTKNHCESASRNDKGAVLISTFIIMATLTVIAAGFLYMNSVQTLSIGTGIVDAKALGLAEAGLQKAIWNLKTPTGSGGQGENWTTTGTTENLGDGSYTLVVTGYDFALATNSSSASDNPAQTNSTLGPSKAIDGNDSTYWESLDKPASNNPQDIIVTFPYPLTINKVRFLVPSGSSNNRPKDYTWAVSTDGASYTTVVTGNNNNATDVTDTFTAQTNVNYLRLRTTKIGSGNDNVRVATLEAIGSKVTSTGTVGSTTRNLVQTVVADDGSPQNQVAYNEIDWNEI